MTVTIVSLVIGNNDFGEGPTSFIAVASFQYKVFLDYRKNTFIFYILILFILLVN